MIIPFGITIIALTYSLSLSLWYISVASINSFSLSDTNQPTVERETAFNFLASDIKTSSVSIQASSHFTSIILPPFGFLPLFFGIGGLIGVVGFGHFLKNNDISPENLYNNIEYIYIYFLL